MAISDVWVGATAPEGGAEGETLVIKDGKYDTAFGVVLCRFELGESGFASEKTAGEIYAYANAGAVIFAVADYSGAKLTFPCLSAAESSGNYTLSFLTNTGDVATGTASSADDPIVISMG